MMKTNQKVLRRLCGGAALVLVTVSLLSGCMSPALAEKTDGTEQTASSERQAQTTEVQTTEVQTTEAPEETLPEQTTEVQAVTTEDTAQTIVTEAAPAVETDGGEDWIINDAGSILVTGHRGIMLYGGGYGSIDNYCAALNYYHEVLGNGVKIYSMNIPTAFEYYLPASYYTGFSQSAQAEYLRGQLCGVTDVNVFEVLRAHKSEDIYLRTDHHWAPLGAYYAAGVFAGTAGVPFADLSAYDVVSIDGYIGSLPVWFDTTEITNYPETFTYYKPRNGYTTTYYDTAMGGQREGTLFYDSFGANYCVFLGSDQLIAHIHSDVGNGRKLCIIKESFGNALVPFLTGSFEDIWVIDIRYFDLNILNFVREQGITDLLAASCSFTCCGGTSGLFWSIAQR